MNLAPAIATYTGRDMENYFAQVQANYASLATPYEAYESLIDGLIDVEKLELLPLYELAARPRNENVRRIGLRHDIDADPITGLRMARFLARRGVCGSFYLLHTAIYFGEHYGPVFIRNPQMIQWIRGFIVAGCEIGIHNDALGAEQRQKGAGAAAFTTELAWMRSQGAVIRGSVAHNSAPSYGAENYEVFAGRVLWKRDAQECDLPLGALNESELGLIYEGTFGVAKANVNLKAADAFCANKAEANIRSEKWMRQYLLENPICDWAMDLQIWLIGSDSWVIAGRFRGSVVWRWDVRLAEVLQFCREMPGGARAALVLHPEYFRST